MYFTVKSVFIFFTNGINFLSFVYSVIIAFSWSKSSFTKVIPSISSSVIYPFNLHYSINSSSKVLCNLLVKSSKKTSLFFVNSLFVSLQLYTKSAFRLIDD